jgi:hypothetical protein
MDEHKEHVEEIAQAAAALYGQDWRHIPGWTRDRWRDVVRQTPRGGGDNVMERAAGCAIDEWYKRRGAPVVVAQAAAVKAEPAAPKKKRKK